MKSSLKFLAILLASASAVVTFSSCATTQEKKHVYIYDEDPEDTVNVQPWTRPSNEFDGNPFGSSVPQSR